MDKTCSSWIMLSRVRHTCMLAAGHDGPHTLYAIRYSNRRRKAEQYHNLELRWWKSSVSVFDERKQP